MKKEAGEKKFIMSEHYFLLGYVKKNIYIYSEQERTHGKARQFN